jgi:hypothetical protein
MGHSLLGLLLLTFTLALAQEDGGNSNSIRFSKLLSQKSDILKFTSISNSPQNIPAERQFQNIYTKEEEVIPARSRSSSTRLIDYPEARVITQPGPGDEFVRIRQGRLTTDIEEEDVDGILTRINQKPVSGRTQVTALRQTSGKRLNISPVFPGKVEQQQQQQQKPREEVEEEDDDEHEESYGEFLVSIDNAYLAFGIHMSRLACMCGSHI